MPRHSIHVLPGYCRESDYLIPLSHRPAHLCDKQQRGRLLKVPFQSSLALSEQLIAPREVGSERQKKKISSATTSFFSVHLSQPCFIAPALFTSPSVPSLSCTIPMVEREGIKDSGSSQRSLLINASASFNLPLNNAAAVSVCACARVCLCAWMRVLHMHVESVIRRLINADNR